MKPLPLEKMPLNYAEFSEECKELTREQKQLVLELRSYIWRFGFLPESHRDLAEKVGLTLRRWLRVAPAIAMHFDHDEDDGRWRDLDLEEARSKHRTREQIAKESGARGGQKKWSNLRNEEEARDAVLRAARDQHREADASELPNGSAGHLSGGYGQPRVGLGYPSQTLAENEADPTVSSLGSGVAPHGLTNLSSRVQISSLKEEQSVNPTPSTESLRDENEARGSERDKGLARVGLGDPSPALAVMNDPGIDIGHVDPSLTLPSTDRGISGCGQGDAERKPAAPDTGGASRDAIAAVIRAAAGDKLVPNWETSKTISRIQDWLADGFELEAHYGEAVRVCVGSWDEPLKHPANERIYKAMCEIRASEVRAREKRGTVEIFDAGARSSFPRFWDAYPHKVDRQNAELRWLEVYTDLKGAVQPIIDGVVRYIAQKPPDQPFLNPANFLRHRRWEDEAASPSEHGSKPRTTAALRRALAEAQSRGGDNASPP